MNRRHLIKSLIAGTVSSALPLSNTAFARSASASKKYPWKNWSGNQQCLPAQRIAPDSIEALQTLIKVSTCERGRGV